MENNTVLDYLNTINEDERNCIYAALSLAYTRYNTTCNGGIFYDWTFKSEEEQNKYASEFAQLEIKLRMADMAENDTAKKISNNILESISIITNEYKTKNNIQ